MLSASATQAAGADQRRDGRGPARRVPPGVAARAVDRSVVAAPRSYAQVRSYAVYPPGRAAIRVSPRIIVPPAHFYRPYYAFRPRVSLGLGLWVGYPVVYPVLFTALLMAIRIRLRTRMRTAIQLPAYGYPAPYPPSGYPASSYPPSGYPPSGASIPGYPTQDPPAQGSVGVQSQEQPAWGGVSFEIPRVRPRYSWTGRTSAPWATLVRRRSRSG